MIHKPEDLQVGLTVYLYPQTKQASRNVHRQLAVQVMKEPQAHWPMVMVMWKEGGEDRWELVHRDNIRLRRPDARVKADEKEGDTTQDRGGMGRWAKVKRMPGRVTAHIEDQMELF